MLKREYKLFKSVENRNALTVLYDREDYKIITTFMITEVTDFYLDVREALESVISESMEEYAFDGNLLGLEIGKERTEVYFQFEEEILGDPCFIPTNELYKLVLEWKEMEEKMYRGEDIFPVILEDWYWLVFFVYLVVHVSLDDQTYIDYVGHVYPYGMRLDTLPLYISQLFIKRVIAEGYSDAKDSHYIDRDLREAYFKASIYSSIYKESIDED